MSPSTAQQIDIDALKDLGYPTAKGESAYYCIDHDRVMTHKNDKSHEWVDSGSGIKYYGYCDAATQLVRGVAGAALALLAVSY